MLTVATVIVVGLISYFNLKWIYKNCSTTQSALLTVLFVCILVICTITASDIPLESPVVFISNLMKSIGLSYPPLS